MQTYDYSDKDVDIAEKLCNIKSAIIVNVHRAVRVLAAGHDGGNVDVTDSLSNTGAS